MSITRLQQARQLYAMGQRVKKSSTGKRPGYRGDDYGAEARGTGAYSDATDTGGAGSEKANVANTKSAVSNLGMTSRDRAIANQYKNMPTPTVTVGVDKFDNPINIKTTYTDRLNRQKNLDALNAKGISSFDPRVNKIGINPFGFNFAPTQKKQFSWGNLAKNVVLGIVAPQLLAGTKLGTAYNAYNSINRINNLVNSLGITDINVIDSLKSNLTSPKSKKFKKSTKIDPKDPPKYGGDGDGQNALLSEYLLLLQRMEKGLLSAEEQGRFNSLKSRLGKADGGIMNINMNKGQLGETLYG